MRQRIIELTREFSEVLKIFPEMTYLGNPVLRKKAKKVELKEGLTIGKRLQAVLLRYRETTGWGRGLAAPQIGESKAVFITYLENQVAIYVNPEIIWRSKKTNCYREVCLSSGVLWADVERPEAIKLRYVNKDDNVAVEEYEGFLARLLQHEYDHLQGIVNLDIARPKTIEFMRNPLKEQLREC